MASAILGLPTTFTDGATVWDAATAGMVTGALEAQGMAALQILVADYPDGGVIAIPDETAWAVSSSGVISPGFGIATHTTYKALALQTTSDVTIDDTTAGFEADATGLYLFAIIETAPNDSRKTRTPDFALSDSATMNGGILIATVDTDADSVTSATDARVFIEFSGGGGSTWRTGSGVPSDASGIDGDFYLNSANGDYYKRISGAYVLQGNLKGANGTNGSAGSQITNGSGAPDDADGANGDYYVNVDSGGLYKKAAGAWSFQTNLTGPQGIPGGSLNWLGDWVTATAYEVDDAAQNGSPKSSYRCYTAHTSDSTTEPGVGADWADYWILFAQAGDTGANGAAGSAFLNGTGVPSSGTGSDGDWYLRTSTSDLYKKISGAWVLQVNIKGLKGDTGATGAAGADATLTGLIEVREFLIMSEAAGVAIDAGWAGSFLIPFDYTIIGVYLHSMDTSDGSDLSGSIVINLYKNDNSTSIVASAKPTLSGAATYSDEALTGWTVDGSAYDRIFVRVESATTVENITLTLALARA